MKFVTDENVSPKVVQALRNAGHDVFDVKEEGLRGVSDGVIIRRARRLKRIIISEDLDFGNLQRYPLAKHPGAILLHFPSKRPLAVADQLLLFLKDANQRFLAGTVVILEDEGISTLKL